MVTRYAGKSIRRSKKDPTSEISNAKDLEDFVHSTEYASSTQPVLYVYKVTLECTVFQWVFCA